MVKEYDVKKLKELIVLKDVKAIKQFMDENDLILIDNIIESKHKDYFKEKQDYWNLEQYVQKIKLNSLYGYLLQRSSLFYDFRLGTSVTLSGRLTWLHLSSSANEYICGKYDFRGNALKGGDTDSCYMSIDVPGFKETHSDFVYSKDNLVEFSNKVEEHINNTYPNYMEQTYHCENAYKDIMKAGREVVATRGIFCGKKRYSLMMIDKDGWRLDTHGKPGKIKIMGIQTQRSDTPLVVRKLLKDMLFKLLVDGTKDDMLSILKEFGENKWKLLNPWEKGTPKACNKLTQYTEQYFKTGKCSVGQVMAAINWNMLIDMNNDKTTPKILDGDKIIVCKLKPNNAFGMTSVAFPVDLAIFPEWFKKLPFDEQSMKDSVVDNTIDTIFGVLGWKLTLENAMMADNDLDGFLSYDV